MGATLWSVKALSDVKLSLLAREGQGLGRSTSPGSNVQPGPGHESRSLTGHAICVGEKALRLAFKGVRVKEKWASKHFEMTASFRTVMAKHPPPAPIPSLLG